MGLIKLSLALVACIGGAALSGNSLAAETIEVMRASGSVAFRQDDQQIEQPVAPRSILPAKHVLVTGPNGRAVVRIGDAGYIVVEKDSKIEVNREKDHAQFLRQVTGMIYYAVNFIKGSQQPLEIRTATATIGVRGTRFLVTDLPERKEIGVRKGLVSVTSPGRNSKYTRRRKKMNSRHTSKRLRKPSPKKSANSWNIRPRPSVSLLNTNANLAWVQTGWQPLTGNALRIAH